MLYEGEGVEPYQPNRGRSEPRTGSNPAADDLVDI